MLTGKQRSWLKRLAQDTPVTVYIGRSGLTETIRHEFENGFESRELVKAKIQQGSELDPAETANLLARELRAEFVQAIGRKFILYRRSRRRKEHIELPE
ncbi:MAG: YhbY family RNA-binding protein [Anaerovoracaceae bacterium]|jgi:RNA-binding protein